MSRKPRRYGLVPDEVLEPRGDGATLYQELDNPHAHRSTGRDDDFMLEDDDGSEEHNDE
jgi:hypothetical protein